MYFGKEYDLFEKQFVMEYLLLFLDALLKKEHDVCNN